MKVRWACRVNSVDRGARLAEFANQHGLVEDGRFWRRSPAALHGDLNARPSG
jgi:hypothetical protein